MSTEVLNKDYEHLTEEENDDCELEPIYDKGGNPTPTTLRAIYEDQNGLVERVTLQEFYKELDEIFGPVNTI